MGRRALDHITVAASSVHGKRPTEACMKTCRSSGREAFGRNTHHDGPLDEPGTGSSAWVPTPSLNTRRAVRLFRVFPPHA